MDRACASARAGCVYVTAAKEISGFMFSLGSLYMYSTGWILQCISHPSRQMFQEKMYFQVVMFFGRCQQHIWYPFIPVKEKDELATKGQVYQWESGLDLLCSVGMVQLNNLRCCLKKKKKKSDVTDRNGMGVSVRAPWPIIALCVTVDVLSKAWWENKAVVHCFVRTNTLLATINCMIYLYTFMVPEDVQPLFWWLFFLCHKQNYWMDWP